MRQTAILGNHGSGMPTGSRIVGEKGRLRNRHDDIWGTGFVSARMMSAPICPGR